MGYYVIRSDQGDGGWSIHLRGMEDENGIAPTLMSGTAELIGDNEWSRPTTADFVMAMAVAGLMPPAIR